MFFQSKGVFFLIYLTLQLFILMASEVEGRPLTAKEKSGFRNLSTIFSILRGESFKRARHLGSTWKHLTWCEILALC